MNSITADLSHHQNQVSGPRSSFNQHNVGGSLATLTSSSMVLSDCTLSLSGSSSPFVILPKPSQQESSSLHLISTQIIGQASHLGPLSHIVPSDTPSSFDIVMASSSMESMCVVDGNSLLFRHSLNKRDDPTPLSTLSSTLLSNSFTNMTSSNQNPFLPIGSLTQRSVGNSVTHSVGALQGTILSDFNLGGSLLCSNTSFEHCTTTKSVRQDTLISKYFAPFFSKYYSSSRSEFSFSDAQFTGTHPHRFWSHYRSIPELRHGPNVYFAPSSSPITFTNCSFTALIQDPEDDDFQGGLAICFDTHAPLTVVSCTFTDLIVANGRGGAIFCHESGYEVFTTVNIETSTFTRCQCSFSGGAVSIVARGINSIVSSSFSGCSCEFFGGACASTACNYWFCNFEGNKVNLQGAAVYEYNTGSINYCMFRKNEAPNGRDWHCAMVVGCTRSDEDWESGTGVVLVTGSGRSEDCTSLNPCQSLASAVSRAKTIGVNTIHVGEGEVGTVTLPNERDTLTFRSHYDIDEAKTTIPSSSLSITCEDESNTVLDTISLSPLPGLPLLKCGLGSQASLVHNCRIVSVDGVSAPLFAVSDGSRMDLTDVLCENISQVSSSLLSVNDLANVTMVRTIFRNVETTHTLVEITTGGTCSVQNSVFHTITRSEGDGAAAIDVSDCTSFTLHQNTFSHCISKNGKAGAITVSVSDPSTLTLSAFFLNNRGKDENCAHDIFLTGFDSTMLTESFYSQVSSFSDSPQVIDGSASPPTINVISDISLIENDVPFAFALDYQPVLFLQDYPFIDHSRAVSQDSFSLTFMSTLEEPITIQPLTIAEGSVFIRGNQESFLQPFLLPAHSTGTLFTVSGEAYLLLSYLFHQLKSSTTEPLITVDSESILVVSSCAFTSDGGLHTAPIVLSSSSSLEVADTSVYNIAFAGHSCFECDGGMLTFTVDSSKSYAVIANITTTGDGAVVNVRNADVIMGLLYLFDCHARNGGVAFFQECQSVYVTDMLALRCSAESKGGAFFVHSVDSVTNLDLHPTLIDCSAELGGGMYLDVSNFNSLTLSHSGWVPLLYQNIGVAMLSNCVAQTGGGIFFDGDWSDGRSIYFGTMSMSNGGPLVSGHDIFFSKSIAESFNGMEQLIETLIEPTWSMSTKSLDDACQFKQVEVEGRPELSRNLDCQQIVLIASDSPRFDGFYDKRSVSSSIHHYLPFIHLKDENNNYRQIPIYLQHTIFFDQTGVVTDQSILLTPDTSIDPAQPTTLSLGSQYWKEDRFFLRLEKEGHAEVSNVQFNWGIDLGLCEVVDGSGTAKISSCVIRLGIALSQPFVSCSAGTLVISQSSFTTADPSPLTVPLIHTSSLSSFASNSAVDPMRIEMNGVQFSDFKVGESLDGIVQLNGVDSLRLKNVDFSNVTNGTSDAVRIFVMGAGLYKTIEPVLNSGFPSRRSELAGLYKSLDISEPVASNYHSPTLLLYLNSFDSATVFASGTGRDGMWCGESDFPCQSLNEADKRLQHAIPSTIEVQTSTFLHSELDLTQDITKIASGSGETGRVEVSKEGCLVNTADTHTHSLTLDSLLFSLTSDRTKTLLISNSGSLIVTSCSFTSLSTSALTSKLIEVSGGKVELTKVELSSISFSDTLLSFSSFVSVGIQNVTHKSCSQHQLMSFDGIDTKSSTIEMRDCVFKGISSSESNEESFCEWDTGLVILNNCSFDGFSSTFSHISQGALRVVDSVVMLDGVTLRENGPRHSSFTSLNWNIGCFGKSEIELASSSTVLSPLSNWISTSDECVVKRGDASIVPHPFFIPTLSIDNCSSKLDQKSKSYAVSISGSTLIPCDLVLVVEEVTDKIEGKNVSIPVLSSFSTFHNETSISLILPESSFIQLDVKLAWNAFLAFENDGSTDSFLFKRTAKEIRAEAMGKTLPWLIPLIVSICVLILIALVMICLCRRRKTADQSTKMSEMIEEDAVQVDEKVEVDQGTQLGVHANEAVDPLSRQSNMETLPEHQQSSEATFSVGLVEALRCGGKLEMTVVREQDTLFNMLHVQKEKKTTIVKRVIERQLAQGLEAVANASLNASILTKLSSHWVMFESNGRVCLKMHDAQPTPSLPNQQPNQNQANVAQEAQRWKAPEVVKSEEGQMSHQPTQEIDAHRAAVFSLGLVLWEIETGSVPFAEQDATNAQRQLGTGAHPKMEGVGPKMQELIEECLALDPTARPELSEVYSVLLSMDDDDMPVENEEFSHSQFFQYFLVVFC
ncbi:hypothetical protein BLNAU_14856 [Blattamonas nauphoetae]|uniref:Protein kinase domain-containing protein n=1 Tax=Blattamonas nauphoetae TaxID=2049346 RepID=A0ABQ9XJ19_9EUKA|nr:hypothetical protein BLNAU_14856 [Blattamonas nauphoetae]